jgi:hypothetical protein
MRIAGCVRVSFEGVGDLNQQTLESSPSTGSLGGLADVEDRLKPRLQQSKRIDHSFGTIPLRANFYLEEIHSSKGQVKDGIKTLMDTDHVARRPLRISAR